MATTPNMYDFLIRPIRLRDQQEGKLFLERFLAGPQEVWDSIKSNIQDVKKLWSVTDCPDAQLQFLKNIVGWTKALGSITKDLGYATLRKLISLSVPMWKARSTETTIYTVLNLLVPGRARIWNFFDLRWILDETVLGEEHQGRDSYLLSMPDDAYWSNVRIVDNPVGTLNRTVVKDVLNLMRPVGERYEIVYLKFLDLFESDGDVSQWDQGTAVDLLVKDGALKLLNKYSEVTWANSEGATLWKDYIVSARVKGERATLAQEGFGVVFALGVKGYYFATLSVKDNKLYLGKDVAGTPTIITSFDFSTIGYFLNEDQWYLLRVQFLDVGATNQIKVYMDGEQYIDTTDAEHDQGTVGIIHDSSLTMECDEIEVLGLPVDSETVEINY